MNKTLGGQSLQRWAVLRMADRKYPWKKGHWSQATFSSNRFFFMLKMWRSIIVLVWVSLEANSETQIGKRELHLELDSRKHW